jgi:pyrroline-5-carboxylate reductase
MVAQSPNLSISELRANVTSKGGTTAAAIAHFEQHNLTQTVADAMDACIDRAQQMEREF